MKKIEKTFDLSIGKLGIPITKVDIEKPYPNEHACRIREPGDFQDGSFRRISEGGLSIIIGRLKGKTKTTTQAFRYPKSSWDADRARTHCSEQGGRFEAAAEKQASWICECLECGYKVETLKHCDTLVCPECGGKMRREERPGIGKFEETNTKYESYSYEAPEDFEIDGIEIKKGQELHYVLGVVLEPDTVDATRTNQTVGDIYSEEEVRKAAHYFLATYNGKGNDFMHSGEDRGDLKIVESYVTPVEMKLNGQEIKKGSWMMATLVLNNDVWERVKKGEITGYSIGGTSNAKVEVTETV